MRRQHTSEVHSKESTSVHAETLSQLISQAKTSATFRQVQPEFVEGLDVALAKLDPVKVTPQLILQALENAPGLIAHAPGLIAQLQQLLNCNTEVTASLVAHNVQQTKDSATADAGVRGGKRNLAPGDYLVLQSPILQPGVPQGGGNQGTSPSSSPVRRKDSYSLGHGSPSTIAQKKVASPEPRKMPSSLQGLKPKPRSPAKPSSPHRVEGLAKPGMPLSSASLSFMPKKADLSAGQSTGENTSAASGEELETKDSVDKQASPVTDVSEIDALRNHKEWADKKIDLLIKRLRDAEGPHRLLKEEVHQLRVEKDSVELRLKEFENSLQQLENSKFTDAAEKKDLVLQLKERQAELRGSHLREQELRGQIQEAQQTVRQEKKRRESLERRLKRATEDLIDVKEHADQMDAHVKSEQANRKAIADVMLEKVTELDECKSALMSAEQQAAALKRREKELEEQLSASHAAASAREEELEGVISALNAQLDCSSQGPQQFQGQPSLYSHFGGPALFGGGVQWLQNSGFSVHLNGMGAGSEFGSTTPRHVCSGNDALHSQGQGTWQVPGSSM